MALRLADLQTDWLRLFLTRAQRRVRLDATIGLEGHVWEVPVHLRGRLVELRYDPFGWERVEVWLLWEPRRPRRRVGLPKDSGNWPTRMSALPLRACPKIPRGPVFAPKAGWRGAGLGLP